MFTSKRFSIAFISTLMLLSSVAVFGQTRPPLPRPSQKASVIQTVGTTDITVTYSRPSVKGRTIWGDWPGDAKGEATLDDGRARPANAPIVPYGHIWRAGANEATLFTVTDDVLINGQPLAAGKYSLHMIPGKEEWTVIFNKDDGQWGSFTYDAKKDALRVKTKPEAVNESKEQLYYNVDHVTENTAMVNLRWEKIRVPFKVEVKDPVGATMSKLRPYVAGAKSDDPTPALSAANYAKTNKLMDDAAKWYDQAVKAAEELFKAKPTYVNAQRRLNVLASAGKTQEAIAAGEKAIELGKAEKADTAAIEKRVADLKASKQ